jgi:SAM-dependent methyltransferase
MRWFAVVELFMPVPTARTVPSQGRRECDSPRRRALAVWIAAEVDQPPSTMFEPVRFELVYVCSRVPNTDYAGHDQRYRELRDQGAPGWATAEDYRELEVELDWALAALQRCTGKRVLEIGCGAGNMSGWFALRGFDVTGIDISPTAVAWANERAIAGARFIVGDVVEEIPGAYDLVIDGHCLHCIIGADRARLLANVRNVLAPGGRFFVATMCGDVTIPELRACFDPVTRCQVVGGIAYRYIGDAPAILEELSNAGFEVVCSTINPRKNDHDQDHLWAIARPIA